MKWTYKVLKRFGTFALACFIFDAGFIAVGSFQLLNVTSSQGTSAQSRQDPFANGWVGNGRASDGTFLGFGSYKIADGTIVGISHGTFRSPKAAENQLHLWLKSATKVIEHSFSKDPAGNINGERFVGFFAKDQSHEQYYAVVWAQGRRFQSIGASSLDTVLEAEKQMKAGRLPSGDLPHQK
jgi:hypothetical protein